MEKNKFAINKSKRLQTLKKKSRELSILCDIDVCFVGTQASNNTENSDSGSCSTSSSSSASTIWQTYPEDPLSLARIINKYRARVDEVQEDPVVVDNILDFDKKKILEFDVDKALKGIKLEDLNLVYSKAIEIAGNVDEKIDLLLKKKKNCSEDSVRSKEGNGHQSKVRALGPKLFGIYLTPEDNGSPN